MPLQDLEASLHPPIIALLVVACFIQLVARSRYRVPRRTGRPTAEPLLALARSFHVLLARSVGVCRTLRILLRSGWLVATVRLFSPPSPLPLAAI